jgi:NAD(P) transhydrogenase subunit alpha
VNVSEEATRRTVVGVPRERHPGEQRVALVPAAVPVLMRSGIDVVVERDAGTRAGFSDGSYASHGARVVSPDEVGAADIVVRVRGWGMATVTGPEEPSHPGQVVIGLADPVGDPVVARDASERGLTAFALDLIPRITRAQAMDALSSQATVTGYKAVLLAAERLPRMFPMLTTAAGTVPPAQVFVLGAGVAGLQAIATARRLGAVVQAYDVRPAAQEDIESLGARSVALPLAPEAAEDEGGYAKDLGEAFSRRQQEFLAQVVAGADVVICTALIPGAPAPILVTEDAVRGMAPGSVIVDCAAERGGNCELTLPDETVLTDGRVMILGPTDLAATVPHDASSMYSKNVTAFLSLLVADGRVEIDRDDEIVRGTLVALDGEIVHDGVRAALESREVANV